MQFFRNILVFASATVLCVSAQDGQPCHKDIFPVTPRHSLDIPKFMGTWYAQEYATSNIGNTPVPDYKCLQLDFSLPNPANVLSITAAETFTDIASGESLTGVSYVAVNDTRSPLSSVWELTSEDGQSHSSVIILFADLEFEKWSVVYSCEIRGESLFRWETVSIYTRDQVIDPELRQTIKALTVGFGFRIGDHLPISQDGCSAA